MNSILITGGAGAIGSRLATELVKSKKVIVVDDLSSGFIDNIPKGVQFLEGDISDKQFIRRVFQENDFEYIFHFAALFANQNSIDNPEKDLLTNGDGTLKLILEALRLAKNNLLKRFVFASSSCVYGKKNGMISEDSDFIPETPYAITKILGERYLRFYSEIDKLPVTILRFFNSYGPGERPGRYRNVIPNFINHALNNEPLLITGTGDETRDFTYIDDVVSCIQKAATDDISVGETYNVATGRETKIKDLAKLIVELSNSKSEVVYIKKRSWDNVTFRCGDITKAEKELGFKPSTELVEGLKQTISWIKHLGIPNI